MEKFVYYNDLLDIYGNLLTEKSLEIFKLYYAENLSMQEIADLLKVSKSFIGTSIKKVENKLEQLEQNLHIYDSKKKIKTIMELEDINEIKNKLKILF